MDSDEIDTVDDFLSWSHKGSVIHETGTLDRERLQMAAQEILAAIDKATSQEDKIARVTAALGAQYFLGARAEATSLDRAIDGIDTDNEPDHRIEMIAIVDVALKFLRESVRVDGAHGARMSKREDNLRDAALRFAKAWEDRKPRF